MDDAALDAEIDVLVGVNRAEALVDADELDGGRGRAGSVVTRAPLPERVAPASAGSRSRRTLGRSGGRAGRVALADTGPASQAETLAPHIGHLLSDM